MLVMTRREGATVYGGKSLTADIEQTYDHAIRVERIVDNFGKRVAEISVRDRDGGYTLYTLTSNARFTNEKARRDLGYKPRDISATIKDTVAFLTKERKSVFRKRGGHKPVPVMG